MISRAFGERAMSVPTETLLELRSRGDDGVSATVDEAQEVGGAGVAHQAQQVFGKFAEYFRRHAEVLVLFPKTCSSFVS